MATSGLATRCPVCSTVFRVVPDQLRVSEGWVRCGRCSEVFNASLSLVDMDTGAPRPPPDGLPGSPGARRPVQPEGPEGPVPASAATPTPAEPPARPSAPEEPLGYDPPLRQSPAVVRFGSGRNAAAPTPTPTPTPTPIPIPTPPTFAAEADVEADSTVVAAARPAAAPFSDPRAEPDDRPAFVQQADRAARWQRPRVRLALGAAVASAALLLLLQAGYQYRELLATGWPATRAALQTTCALLGCRINAAHAIDSLSVESSGLLRVEKSNTYSLSVGLRNRSTFEVALPALELSLTDSQGRLIARRVVNTGELGSAQNTLAASSDVALQATLLVTAGTGSEPVAGYTIELFYP